MIICKACTHKKNRLGMDNQGGSFVIDAEFIIMYHKEPRLPEEVVDHLRLMVVQVQAQAVV